jgi:hypothetical protein
LTSQIPSFSGTTNYHAKFTSGTTIGNSLIWDNGTNVGIGNQGTTYTLDVSGTLRNTTSAYFATTSGGVGIGNTSAAYTLDVTGTARFTSTTYIGNATANPSLKFLTGGSTNYNAIISTDSNADYLVINGGASASSSSGGQITVIGNDRYGTAIGGQITIAAGTSANNSAYGYINFNTGATPTERMRITNLGYIGIGLASSNPAAFGYFAVAGTITVNTLTGVVAGFSDNVNGTTRLYVKSAVNGISVDQAFAISTGGGTPVERFRITSGGQYLFGGITSPFGAGLLCISTDLTGANAIAMKNTSGTNSGNFMVFQNQSEGSAGSIAMNSSSTILFIASSDYRLKSNVLPMQNAIDRILKINPVIYNWKNSDDEVGEGFIAHELKEVVPLAVFGEKDEMNIDGSIKPQGIDYGKLTPLLVAAMQEQQAQIEELSNRLIKLESK